MDYGFNEYNDFSFLRAFYLLYCSVFNSEATKDLIKWGVGTMIFLLGVSMLKIFAWMQMDKNALLREVKRLELQVSSLAGKNIGIRF